MATKKKEIYARMASQLRHHERAAKAEMLCPGAMGLYLFLNLQARGEATHGETFEAIALASWGAPLAYRRKQADALIKVGLVVREGDDLVIVKYLEHNDGPEEIASAKEATRKRVASHRSNGDVTRYTSVTDDACNGVGNASVPISISISKSSSESRSEDPDGRTETPANDAPATTPPGWWPEALKTVSAEVLGGKPIPDPSALWFEYLAGRSRKRWAMNQVDAVGWLSSVVSQRKSAMLAQSAREPQGGASARARVLLTGSDD